MPNKHSMQLSNQFLIAMPSLADSNFAHSVTFLCEHSEGGTMGLTINRPLEISLGEIFEQMKLNVTNTSIQDTLVFGGGPVQLERGFVLHNSSAEWDATLKVSDELSVTSSRDILEAIAQDKGPDRFLVALGYSGWAAGQLEKEILDNSWLHGPVDNNIIFDSPVNTRWKSAAQLLGIDVTLISPDSGHA
jgi:putative transcriptional regulator